jgi:hypothetical protein
MSDLPGQEMLPLSLLSDFLYRPRRAGLKIIEGWPLQWKWITC